MSELQTIRKKIQGDFFLEKSYREGKLFYEALIHKDDYIGINYGYLEDELREETYINDNRIGMIVVNEKDKIYSGRLAYEMDYLDDICMATNRIYKNDFIKKAPLVNYSRLTPYEC